MTSPDTRRQIRPNAVLRGSDKRCRVTVLLLALIAARIASAETAKESAPPPLPDNARLVMNENWSSGQLDPDKWYTLEKKWGRGNNGVVPENVRIETDEVRGRRRYVLVCEAHGDEYDGPVEGFGGKTRVGGVAVSKAFFASGRFEIVLKIRSTDPQEGGPKEPTRPRGSVPAIWTYGYRYVRVPGNLAGQFTSEVPLYNPHMSTYRGRANEYWTEIDFPEFGKAGDFDRGLYNTFLQNRHESRVFDVGAAVDGRYHTLTTEWRTRLEPLEGVTDDQVVEHEGYWWVQDKAIPFERYFGNPLKRLGKDRYAVYMGDRADHWIDGKKVGENTKYVPAMAAQLNLGIWLPDWAGPAPWRTARVSFASVKVWQYDDPGDVRGIITEDIPSSPRRGE